MFQEQNYKVTGFDSSWKKEKLVKEQSLQTTEFSTKDKIINTTSTKCIEVQTDPVTNSTETDVDMEKLGKWLKKIYPTVIHELNDTTLSSALASAQTFKPTSLEIQIVQNINLKDLNENFNKQELYVSALSWSCTGNTIAVACSFKHDIWCYHQGEVLVFSFTRNERLSEIPNKKLKCGSCVTSLSFHPIQPSILSAGTISGEVYLWRLQDEGDSLLSSYTAHDERVSLISWVSNADTKSSIVLVSAGLDSYLNVWKIHDSTLHVDQRYKCQYYTNKLYSSNVEKIPKKTDRGIVCFDFSPHFPGLFVLGMEGGFVLKCSLIGAKLIPGNKMTAAILDPFVSSFSSHQGEVSNIAFSPHRKDLFFSCGTDEQIKIFHIDQDTPVQIIFVDIAINFASWILCESKLLIGGGEDGSFRIFSLLNGQQIETNANFTNQSLTYISVNNIRLNMLAVGNNEGALTLWSVPWNNIAAQDDKNVFNS